MSRPRKDLGKSADQTIIDLMSRGGTAESISAALGISKTTTFRRMKELKGAATESRLTKRSEIKAAPKSIPDDEDITDDTPLEQITLWLNTAEEEMKLARAAGEFDQMNKMMRLAATLLTLKQKATPIALPDPNDNPDFIALAEKVRKRWHALLDKVK